eukprot:gene12547-biopygen6355
MPSRCRRSAAPVRFAYTSTHTLECTQHDPPFGDRIGRG